MDGQLNTLTEYVINGWPATKVKVKEEIQPYWLYRDDSGVADGTVRKAEEL